MSADDLMVWRCGVHGEVILSDFSVRQMVIPPMCPKRDVRGRMGVCGRRLSGPHRRFRQPSRTARRTPGGTEG